MFRVRLYEILHLHLLKLARTQDEVARGDLVAKRLADLRNTKRNLASHRCLYVEKVNEDALRSFWSKIRKRRRIIFNSRGTQRRAKHHVEEPRLRKVRRLAVRTLDAFLPDELRDPR